MKCLLYDSRCIETTDTALSVIRRIEARVDHVDSKVPRNGQPLFEGSVGGDEFRLFRIIRSKNLFLPLIRGKVLSTPGGAIVKVRMRPHGFALTFLLVWFGLAILLPLCSIWTQGDPRQWLAAQPGSLIAVVLMWVLAAVLVGYEARRAREALTALIRGVEPTAAVDGGRDSGF